MKVAVLVGGMYREFDIAINSWNFLNDIDCDVYFSTWSKSIQKNSRLNISINEDVIEDRIKKYLPNSIVSILDETKYNHLNNPEKLIFHWKECMRLLELSKKKYDIVILTRPDNYFELHNKWDCILKFNYDNIIYGIDEIHDVDNVPYTNDIFFIGNYETMKYFLKNIDDRIYDLHRCIANTFINFGLILKKMESLYVCTIRANARDLDKFTLESVFKKQELWGENQSQYSTNL
jgi:uncharacterized protein (DUF488 family)